MALYKDIDVAHLKPNSVMVGEGYTLGKLAQDSAVGYLKQDALCLFADSTFAAINLACDMIKTPKGECWNSLRRHATCSEDNDGAGWTAFLSFSESVQALLYNPKRLYDVKYRNDIITEESTSGNQIYHDVTGDYLDIDRYLMGDPECFANASDGKLKTRFVDIILLPDVAAHTNSGDILKLSMQVSRMVEWLEFNQIRCRIIGAHTCECAHSEIKLKDYHEKLNENEIKVFCSPDYFRRISFVFDEFSPTWERGYGRPQGVHLERLGETLAHHRIAVAYNNLADIFGLQPNYVEHFDNALKKLVRSLDEEGDTICV